METDRLGARDAVDRVELAGELCVFLGADGAS
jgi:hypothetical protein